jgi:hypothetical protein
MITVTPSVFTRVKAAAQAPNLVLGKSGDDVYCNTVNSTSSAANAFDGKYDTYWRVNSAAFMKNANEAWISVKLGDTPVQFNEVFVMDYNTLANFKARVEYFKIEYSNDDAIWQSKTWEKFADWTPTGQVSFEQNSKGCIKVELQNLVSAKYVRYVFKGPNIDNPTGIFGVMELEVRNTTIPPKVVPELTSETYTVNNSNYTISNIANNTSVREFLTKLIPADPNVDIKIVTKDDPQIVITDGNISENMIVIASINGNSNSYSLILLNSSTALASSEYVIINNVIIDIPSGTSVSQLKQKVSVTTGAGIEIYQPDGTTIAAGEVVEDMIVKVTAEDKQFIENYFVGKIKFVGGKTKNIAAGAGAAGGLTTKAYSTNSGKPMSGAFDGISDDENNYWRNSSSTDISPGNQIWLGVKLGDTPVSFDSINATIGHLSRPAFKEIVGRYTVQYTNDDSIWNSSAKPVNNNWQNAFDWIDIDSSKNYDILYKEFNMIQAKYVRIVFEIGKGLSGSYIGLAELEIMNESDTSLVSLKFPVDRSSKKIGRVIAGTTVKELLDDIRPANGSSQLSVIDSTGVQLQPQDNVTESCSLKVVSTNGKVTDFYGIVASSKGFESKDLSLTSNYYTVNSDLYVIKNMPIDTEYSEFMSKLKPGYLAQLKLYEADGKTEVTAGKIHDGMNLVITSEAGESRTYIVEIMQQRLDKTVSLKIGETWMIFTNNTSKVFDKVNDSNPLIVPVKMADVTMIPVEGFAKAVKGNLKSQDNKYFIELGGKITEIEKNDIVQQADLSFVPFEKYAIAVGRYYSEYPSGLIIIGESAGKLDLTRNADIISEITDDIANKHYAIADTTLIAPGLSAAIGEMSLINLGDVLPAIGVNAFYNISVKGNVIAPAGNIIETINNKDIAKNENNTITLTKKADEEGTYRIDLLISVDGGKETYRDCLYFTATSDKASMKAVYLKASKLIYVPDYKGNTVADFSNSGYMGGGVRIPDVPVRVIVEPLEGSMDDYARIQAAVDKLSSMPIDSTGFRGALLIKAGSYKVSKTISIKASGVVIRGEGWDDKGSGPVTKILATEVTSSPDVNLSLFKFEGNSIITQSETAREVKELYVPSGSRNINISTTDGLKVGDKIIVRVKKGQSWIHETQMDSLGGRADGGTVTPWQPFTLDYDRIVTAINGNTITIDAPITDAISYRWGGGEVFKYENNGKLNNVGIENFCVDSVFDPSVIEGTGSSAHYSDENHTRIFAYFAGVENAWVREFRTYHMDTGAKLSMGSKWATVQDGEVLEPVSTVAGERRYAFNYDKPQLSLTQRGYADNARHPFVSGSRVLGPNVFLNSVSTNDLNSSEPHHRWATGGLYDNITSSIAIQNRWSYGSGHGLAGANYVLWNTKGNLIATQPSTAQTYVFGHNGILLPPGFPDAPQGPAYIVDSFENYKKQSPESLYLQQLKERLGDGALENIKRYPIVNIYDLPKDITDDGGSDDEAGIPPTTPPIEIPNEISNEIPKVDPAPYQKLIDEAFNQKTFYHYNTAYFEIMKLTEGKDKDMLLEKLTSLSSLVWTEEIKAISKMIDELAATSSGKLYDEIQIVINNASISYIDKAYLLGEVTSWGMKLVWSPDYSEAVEKLIKAWEKLDDTSINEAETAVRQVKNVNNKNYLLEEIMKLRIKYN